MNNKIVRQTRFIVHIFERYCGQNGADILRRFRDLRIRFL